MDITGKTEANCRTVFQVVIKTAVTAKCQKAIGKKRVCSRHASCQKGYDVLAEIGKSGEPVYSIA